jgi:hypothetical protein
MKQLLTACAVFISISYFAQPEHLAPVTHNATQTVDAAANRSRSFSGDTINLPSTGFRDDFSYDDHRPDTTWWNPTLNPGIYVNRGWARSPLNIGVCTFDGLDFTGMPYDALANANTSSLADELTSRHINMQSLSVGDSVYLSFWYQAGGKGYAPNPTDSLILQYNVPSWNSFSTEVWKTIWYMEGYTPQGNDTGFHLVMLKLDSASYFQNGFRFRFRNYASVCGSNDHWHIDEVFLKQTRSFADTLQGEPHFVYDMPTMLKDFHVVPGRHYVPSMMASDVDIFIRNNDDIPRNVTYTYEVYDPTSATPIFTYNGGADGNLQPFYTSGYSPYAPHANPNVTPFSYPGFSNPEDTGTYYVHHMLKKGTSASAPVDTVIYKQHLYNYYAYDDGTAEVGYGIYGSQSLMAYKFTLPPNVTDTLKSVMMYFLPVVDQPNIDLREFRLTVWAHNSAANQPGTVLYTQYKYTPEYRYDTPNRFVEYTIDSGTVVLSGTFYIGWQQLATDRLYIGFDFNNDQSDKIYYNTSGVWYTSIFDGALMMRPVFGGTYDVTGNDEVSDADKMQWYPNPTSTDLTVSGLPVGGANTIEVFDVNGRLIQTIQTQSSQHKIDVSTWNAGLYLVRVLNADGAIVGSNRVVVGK